VTNETKEIHMTTSISTKLAALALALTMNSVVMGSVAYLFNTHPNAATISLAQTSGRIITLA
jgi:hypothetical protein